MPYVECEIILLFVFLSLVHCVAAFAGEIGPLPFAGKLGELPFAEIAYAAVEVPKFNVPKLMHADFGNPVNVN